MSLGQRWTLGASLSYGHASYAFMGPLHHTVGAPAGQRGLHKQLHERGVVYRRTCANCRAHWHDCWTLTSPPGTEHLAVAAPNTVYICPKCRTGRNLIIIPGRWKL